MDVRLPDGTMINNVPDDMSKADLTAKLARNGYDVSKLQQAPQAAQQPTPEAPSGFAQGLRDPITAGAQLLTHGIEAIGGGGLVRSGNRLNNWLVDKGVPIARIPDGGMDDLVKQQENEYQQGRQAAGKSGIDLARIAGNIANPANLVAASRLPQAASLVGRVGVGAASGAAFGAAQPVTDGDFWTEKAKQAGMGAAIGGALPAVTGGIARVIKPNTRPQVKAMLNEGITPTPGQIIGGRTQAVEDKLTSLPIVGDAISSARTKNLNEFQLASYRRALAPIGGKPSGAVGRDGIADVHTQLSDAYNSLLPKMTFKADPVFAKEFDGLKGLVSSLPQDTAKYFEDTVKRELFGRMTPKGLMSGESLQDAISAVGKEAKSFGGKGGFEGKLGDAFSEVQNILRNNLARNNPQQASQLASNGKGWANYAILRDAASKVGAKDGMFTPAQLGSSVASAAKVGRGAAGKARVSEGKALMQDLTDAGQNVLSSKYPDSGTAGRVAMGAGTLGGLAAFNPASLTAVGLSTLMYLPGGRQAISALLTKRPEMAGQLASLVRKTSPTLNPGLASLFNSREN